MHIHPVTTDTTELPVILTVLKVLSVLDATTNFNNDFLSHPDLITLGVVRC